MPDGFQKADSIISYDSYYKSAFQKRREPKTFAKQFNKYYQTEEAYLLGLGTAFLLDADRTLISKYRWTYKEITDNLLKDCL